MAVPGVAAVEAGVPKGCAVRAREAGLRCRLAQFDKDFLPITPFEAHRCSETVCVAEDGRGTPATQADAVAFAGSVAGSGQRLR